MRRLQAMFSHPIGDRGFVSAEPPADLGERQPLPKKLLQRSPIHAVILVYRVMTAHERL